MIELPFHILVSSMGLLMATANNKLAQVTIPGPVSICSVLSVTDRLCNTYP